MALALSLPACGNLRSGYSSYLFLALAQRREAAASASSSVYTLAGLASIGALWRDIPADAAENLSSGVIAYVIR